MRELGLSNSKLLTLVDDEDYDRLMAYKWRLTDNRFSILSTTCLGKNQVNIANFIMKNYEVIYDHRDVNCLNNQKINLRVCTIGQNNANKPKYIKTLGNYHSKYKVVTKHSGKWQSQIVVNRQRKHLGTFEIEEVAAKAYDLAALKYFGEFANINFKKENYGL